MVGLLNDSASNIRQTQGMTDGVALVIIDKAIDCHITTTTKVCTSSRFRTIGM